MTRASEITAEITELGDTDRLFVYNPEGGTAPEKNPFLSGLNAKRTFARGGGLLNVGLKSSAYTASAGEHVPTTTAGGTWTLTLPATPSDGDEIEISDRDGTWSPTNYVLLGRNGQNIDGAADNDFRLDGGTLCRLRFYTGYGWKSAFAAGAVDLSSKQDTDADLTALAALSGTGLAARTAANAWATRTLTAASAKLTVVNGGGVAGNPSVDLGTVASTDLSDAASLYKSGGTDVAVADGGTGASSAAAARTNLDVAGTALSIVEKTADFTLALTDSVSAGRQVYNDCNHATALTVTVPANASVAFPVGALVYLARKGVGTVTIAAAGGVTINKPADRSLTLRVQHSAVTLIKKDTNVWQAMGDLT